MSPRPVVAAVVTSLFLATAATACGSSRGPTGPSAVSLPRLAPVQVEPPSGPIGTMFTLTTQGLKEGDAVAFEITFPGQGKAYPGAALTVLADGTASTTYRATTANQPGVYTVRLTGPPGNLAEGRFTVSDGPAITSTVPDTASSSSLPYSGRTSTTSRFGRTTTTSKTGSTTSSTVRGVSTTSTTKHLTGSSTTIARIGPPVT